MSMSREVDKWEQKIVKAAKELELRERECTIEAKQYKQGFRKSRCLLKHFDEELNALQESKLGFL